MDCFVEHKKLSKEESSLELLLLFISVTQSCSQKVQSLSLSENDTLSKVDVDRKPFFGQAIFLTALKKDFSSKEQHSFSWH